MTGKAGVEWAKWLGFALMLADHANSFLLDHRFPVLFVLGRLVFPLFAFALAEGLAGRGELRATDTFHRLLLWGLIAQVPWSQFESAYALNVMFTLAAGLALWICATGGGILWKRVLWAVAAAFLAVFCEYGVAGVGFVVAALWWRERPSHVSAAAVVAALACLVVPNHSWWALLGLPAFLGLRYLGELPRARHWFYPMYAAQFVAFGFLAWRLG